MILRAAKTALVFGVALYFSLIVFNNLSDYGSNYQFVRHVLMMDSTFPGNGGLWRSLNASAWHAAFYWLIIAWELAAAVLCWWGGWRLAMSVNKDARKFSKEKNVAIAGLTLGLLLWLVAFIAVGGEWFLMWQSAKWNGEEAAFRIFSIAGIVLILLALPETADQS
jgi:predicted small integral membrane protein